MSQNITNNAHYHTHHHYDIKWYWGSFILGTLFGCDIAAIIFLFFK